MCLLLVVAANIIAGYEEGFRLGLCVFEEFDPPGETIRDVPILGTSLPETKGMQTFPDSCICKRPARYVVPVSLRLDK